MNISSISRKNKKLIITTLLLNAVAIGLFVFLFIELKAKNEHISALANQIEEETKEEQTQNSVKTLVSETASLRDELKSYIIGTDGAVSFFELLERIGSDIGVSVVIDSVAKNELPSTLQVEQLQLGLRAEGTWSGVVRFLGLLEFLPYEARVGQVVFGKATARGAPWRVNLTLFVLKEK